MLWTEHRPVIKIGPKGALGSHEVRPIHSAPSLGQSIADSFVIRVRLDSFAISKYNLKTKQKFHDDEDYEDHNNGARRFSIETASRYPYPY